MTDFIQQDLTEEAGDVTGLNLEFHLQCHFGLDTLGMGAPRRPRRRGRPVAAGDRSRPARSRRAAGLDAEFVVANVYDAPTTLRGRTFDRVYTGIGALCWLPDIDGGRAWSTRCCVPAAACTSSSSIRSPTGASARPTSR